MYGKEKEKINANWIWHEKCDNPINQWVVFRKKMNIDKEIEKATLIATADARYWAYINGEFILRGPAKAFSHEYFYDRMDITRNISVGENLISFTAHHIGVNIHQHILGEPGFLCQINILYKDGTEDEIISDDTFKVSIHEGFMPDTFRISCGQGYTELYDARKEEAKIHEKHFDDSRWENAVTRYPYGKSFWGNLQIKETPSFIYDPVFPKTVISNCKTESDGVSVVMDFNHKFLEHEDLEIVAFRKPQWFYTFFDIESPCDMDLKLTFCYSRLWCAFGKFSINGKTYIDHMDDFVLDPRQEGPLSVEISLKKGKNHFVMNCSNDSMGKHFHMYFDTKGKTLEFYNPLTGEKGAGFTASHLKDVSSGEKENLCSKVWDILNKKDFEKLDGMTGSIDEKYISFNSPQIPSVYREIKEAIDLDEALPVLHGDNRELTIKKDRYDREITFDMGSEVAGMINFEITAPSGVVVDFYGVEYIDMEGKRQEMDGVCNGFRYITGQGTRTYTSHIPRGFRYLIMSLRNICEDVYIKKVSVISSTHPVMEKGYFICDDYKLNRIWEISKKTSELCMMDTSVDCPGHEQSFWTGDFRNEALIGHYLFGAYEHTDHCLKVGMGSLKKAPLPESSVPSVPQGVMPTWALLFMLAYHELYMYSGSRDILEKHYERFVLLIENCMKMTDESGLFKPPFNDMLDWSFIDLRPGAYNSHSNALLYKNLLQIADCAEYLDKKHDADQYRKMASELKGKINSTLWVKDKKAFADCMTPEGEFSGHFSIQVQSVMVMTGCADSQKEKELKKYFESGFPEDFQHIGSPFASMFYHEALSRLGLIQVILDDIRQGWGKMTDVGSTTCFETFPGWEHKDLTRSHCHAWSASPAYIAGHDILGVSPLAPGFSEVLISPNLGDLEWARGKVPVPGGYISVDVRKEGDKTKVKVLVPEGIKVITSPGYEYDIKTDRRVKYKENKTGD